MSIFPRLSPLLLTLCIFLQVCLTPDLHAELNIASDKSSVYGQHLSMLFLYIVLINYNNILAKTLIKHVVS